jgi:hypothetical protein
MIKDIIAVKPIKDYQLHLIFEDHREGVVDLAEIIEFNGIFAPLKDPEYFASVWVNPDLGTICWDNGTDIDPVLLYVAIANPDQPISNIREHLLPKLMSDGIRI